MFRYGTPPHTTHTDDVTPVLDHLRCVIGDMSVVKARAALGVRSAMTVNLPDGLTAHS